MNNNKQLAINIIASFTAFLVSFSINFFLSPYIIENVGAEAYGFVSLTNNLISYFSIITVALNSMSSRFISISYFKDDVNKANQYFSSTFFSNLILCSIFAPILCIIVINITMFINVSDSLVLDVQMLMGIMSINFIIGLLATNLGISFYVKNKLYLSSLIGIICTVIRGGLLLVLYTQFAPYITYMGIATLICTIITIVFNLFYRKQLIPELVIKYRYFNKDCVKILLSSGIWNVINRLGGILSEGLDLLITNLFISATSMGTLAIAKSIPGMITSVLNSLIGSFMPNLTQLYAEGEEKKTVENVKQSMKIIGMIINIPIALLVGYGTCIYRLWVPSQDAELIHILSVFTILPWAVMGQATVIHNVLTVVNKVKTNAILVCITGLLNVITVYFLLKYTNGGIYVVAGVSSLYNIMRNLCYTVPFGAIYLNAKWYTFFPDILKSVSSVITISLIGTVISNHIMLDHWFILILVMCMTGGMGLVGNYFIVLGKSDRAYVNMLIMKKMRRGVNN
ncbi:MAG: MATE family efflux transporter [Lachnospiraceae bacterium]